MGAKAGKACPAEGIEALPGELVDWLESIDVASGESALRMGGAVGAAHAPSVTLAASVIMVFNAVLRFVRFIRFIRLIVLVVTQENKTRDTPCDVSRLNPFPK